MATVKDLNQAFITFGVFYLNNEEIAHDPKIVDALGRFLMKQEIDMDELPDLPDGSVAADKLAKLKDKAKGQDNA